MPLEHSYAEILKRQGVDSRDSVRACECDVTKSATDVRRLSSNGAYIRCMGVTHDCCRPYLQEPLKVYFGLLQPRPREGGREGEIQIVSVRLGKIENMSAP